MYRATKSQLIRLTAVSFVSLHATAYVTSVTALLSMVDTGVFALAASSQTYPNQAVPATPVSQNTVNLAQLPNVTPEPSSQPLDPIVPPPERFGTSNPPAEFNRYRLGPGDSISVIVQRFPDLSFQATVNSEGNIIVPLAGAVRVARLTVAEIQTLLRNRLNRFVVNPIVTVALIAQRPAQVTVIGEVVRPGYYALTANSQLIAALQVAGGSTNKADLRSVLVRRAVSNNSTIEQKVDLFTPLQNAQSLPDLRLQDGDVVFVQRLEVGTTADYDRRLVARSSLAQQQITIRVLSYPNSRVGNLNLPNGSTFIDAVSGLGLNLDRSDFRKIALIRFDPEQGKAVTQTIDGKRALRGDVSQNVPLQDNDVIVVGRNLVGKVLNTLNTITEPFRGIGGFLRFFEDFTP